MLGGKDNNKNEFMRRNQEDDVELTYHPQSENVERYERPNTNQDFLDAEESEYENEEGVSRLSFIRPLLFVLVFLLVMFVGIYLFVPDNTSGLLGALRKPGGAIVSIFKKKKKEVEPKIESFARLENQNSAENQAFFEIKTNVGVKAVRIENANGEALNGSSDKLSDDGKDWAVTLSFENSFSGNVYPAFLHNEKWVRADMPVSLDLQFEKESEEKAKLQPEIDLNKNNGKVVQPENSKAEENAEADSNSESNKKAGETVSDKGKENAEQLEELEEINPDGDSDELKEDLKGLVDEKKPVSKKTSIASFEADDSTKPSKFKLQESVFKSGKKQKTLSRENKFNLPLGEEYMQYKGGVFTFRGDNFRQNAAFGVLKQSPTSMSIEWEKKLSKLQLPGGMVYGIGWTGQPAIVKWGKEVREASNIVKAKKSRVDKETGKSIALKEVIVSSLDGNVYFLDLEDGKETRKPIRVGFPMRGSVSVDPMGRPIIAFGQNASKTKSKSSSAGVHVYNALNQKRLYLLEGKKNKLQAPFSTNTTFDGTPLFTGGEADSLVVGGENGLFYTLSLNTKFNIGEGKLSIKPQLYYQRSKGVQKNQDLTIEGSVAAYQNHAFVADRHGILRAINMDTMRTTWAFDLGDNTDSTPALDMENDGNISLYIGNGVFTRQKGSKNVFFRKLNALNGSEIWKYKLSAEYDKDEKGGIKASPVIGKGPINDYVYVTCNLNANSSKLVALNKSDGSEVWSAKLASASVSSPVAVYTENNEAYIIQATEKGHLIMLNAKTGELVTTLNLGGKIEGSPAVYNDMLVIGTCSKDAKLFGIRIK